MTIRVLIADDEPLARRRLVRFLRAEPDVEIVAECAGGAAAVTALAEHEVDLALLDVQMPDMDGFEVVSAHLAARGADRMPPVVFVTAYDEYAIRAFEVHALDYLLKPVTAERFQAAFKRAREHMERVRAAQAGRRLKAMLEQVLAGERAADGGVAGLSAIAAAWAGGSSSSAATASAPQTAQQQGQYADRITIKTDGRVFVIKVSDVDWFEAQGNYVRVHAGKAAHLIRETITAVESSLNPAQFARIHRSTVVNLDRIRELQPWFAGDYLVILKDGTQLKLSRTFRDQLQARLKTIS
jgi:two-component system, LytTR family, response regulator